MAQPCGGVGLGSKGPRRQPTSMRLAAPGTHSARSYAGPAGLREGRGPGRGWPAAGAEPRAARARRRGSARRCAGRASLCSLCHRWGRWSRGPRARSSPRSLPKRPRAAGSAGFGSWRWGGRAEGLVRERSRGAVAPIPRGGRGSWRPPPCVSRSASLLGRLATPLRAPRPRPGPLSLPQPRPRPLAFPPLPIPGFEPPASQAHALGPAFAGPPPPTSSFGARGPASASLGRARGPGAGRSLSKSWPGSTQGFLPGHLKTSPQREDGGGDWPGAAVCLGLRLVERADFASRVLPLKLKTRLPVLTCWPGSATCPAWRENPRSSLFSGNRWACYRGEEGLDKKGYSCLRERASHSGRR